MKLMHRPLLALTVLWTALCLAIPTEFRAQTQSLAELARQERAKKTQGARSARVFTNEDIPEPTITGTPTAEAEAQPAAETKAEEPPATDEKAAGAPEKTSAEIEKEYRDKFAKLKEAQELEERRLDVMQRELNLAQQQFYSDPNVALREQYGRADINKRTADIEAQKAAVEKAKQAIADLETELRAKSLPPGWAR